MQYDDMIDEMAHTDGVSGDDVDHFKKTLLIHKSIAEVKKNAEMLRAKHKGHYKHV